jgi:hypothetical protein
VSHQIERKQTNIYIRLRCNNDDNNDCYNDDEDDDFIMLVAETMGQTFGFFLRGRKHSMVLDPRVCMYGYTQIFPL